MSTTSKFDLDLDDGLFYHAAILCKRCARIVSNYMRLAKLLWQHVSTCFLLTTSCTHNIEDTGAASFS
jgi:hypothetical protein